MEDKLTDSLKNASDLVPLLVFLEHLRKLLPKSFDMNESYKATEFDKFLLHLHTLIERINKDLESKTPNVSNNK